MSFTLLAVLLLMWTPTLEARPHKPHIIHILADDFGWSEVGYHRSGDHSGDVKTPFIDELVTESLQLDRHYVHQICSPSRCALQTGRAPIHVNVQNVLPESVNPKDTVGGYQGIPINMTGLAEHLQSAGYRTHAVGKWDVGMATPYHSPRGRGYDTWLGYWHHSNDYWQQTVSKCNGESVHDLWWYNESHDAPATWLKNGPDCSQKNQNPAGQQCVFEEKILTDRVKEIIQTHNQSDPLFLFWSMHLVHMPLEIPKAYLDKFSFIDNEYRQLMHAMANYLDNDVKEVVSLLKTTGMWNDTLVIFHSDNGGEILDHICGGNNWPLRGGKFSNWEGGIRVNAFASGGVLPIERRGLVEDGLVTGWDWYATYAALAGVDPTDHKAAKAGLPPIDSIDVWPLIAGTGKPRSEIAVGATTTYGPNADGSTYVGGLIQGHHKLIVGTANKFYLCDQDVRTGPIWPNSTSHLEPLLHERVCGRKPDRGCLFDIYNDPYELNNLAHSKPEVFKTMLARVDALQKTVYSPDRGHQVPEACQVAEGKYGGYWGPFLDL